MVILLFDLIPRQVSLIIYYAFEVRFKLSFHQEKKASNLK